MADKKLCQNRFLLNRAGYVTVNTLHRREYFALQVELYELLAAFHARRIKAATAWLERGGLHEAEPFRLLRPHTPEWFASLREWDPKQASMVEFVVGQEGPEVCSICGDDPALDYALVGPPVAKPGTLRLCDGSFSICSGSELMKVF